MFFSSQNSRLLSNSLPTQWVRTVCCETWTDSSIVHRLESCLLAKAQDKLVSLSTRSKSQTALRGLSSEHLQCKTHLRSNGRQTLTKYTEADRVQTEKGHVAGDQLLSSTCSKRRWRIGVVWLQKKETRKKKIDQTRRKILIGISFLASFQIPSVTECLWVLWILVMSLIIDFNDLYTS